jgi:DNA-directed RNA polymerase subunit RPC12/RpoP
MPVHAKCPKCGFEIQLGPIITNVGLPTEEKKPVEKISDIMPGYKARCTECNVEMNLWEG